MTELNVDPAILEALLRARMPFGRYAGCPLLKLPEPYLVWFSNQGFPEGLLGQQMALALEIKINGLERMLTPLLDPLWNGDTRRR